MNETFVTYKQAKLLYDLGFDWNTLQAYYDNIWSHSHQLVFLSTALQAEEDCDGTEVYLAPRLDQAQKWLREVKGIDVLVFNCACGYGWEISKADEHSRGTTIALFDDNGDDEASGMWATYEKALTAGIDITLRLLKE